MKPDRGEGLQRNYELANASLLPTEDVVVSCDNCSVISETAVAPAQCK